MKTPWNIWAGRAAVTAANLALLAVFSHTTLGSAPENGQLRLSWNIAGQKLKTCRPYTTEELAQIPQHMRQAELCESQPLPYVIKIALDGQELRHDKIVPGGSHNEGLVAVQNEFNLRPGTYELAIDFALEIPSDGDAAAAETEDMQKARAAAKAYQLREKVVVEAGRVVFVTLDRTRGEFTVQR